MKTLDEVIDDLRLKSGLIIGSKKKYDRWDVPIETIQDALHYLQVFAAKRKVLEYKEKHYDEIVESMLKEGQEIEARCQAEIARYQEAVKNCEAAELKYRKLEQELGNNLAELRNEDQRYPNILFRPEGMYCCVCGSRLDQDREDADGRI